MKMAYSDKIMSNALMLGTRLNPAERLENVNESARRAAFSCLKASFAACLNRLPLARR